MIQKTMSFKCRPSQLVNLDKFLLAGVIIPLLVLMNSFLKEYVPGMLMPDIVTTHLHGLPVYLAVVSFFVLGYSVVRVYATSYEVDPEELRISSGVFYRKKEYAELYRIKDYRLEKPLVYRLFGMGDLILYTSNKTTPVLKLEAIRKPESKYETIRQLVEHNRRAKHVYEID